ncbi:MAG: hypothetical protein IIB37_05805 [Gemmatimonadetes bacterium]|nr:hypothetical protein [Gemmatimonadota bacterium]
MFKFALTALALSFIVLAAQPASAQQAAESTPITLTATVVDLSCNTVYGLAGDDHRMCSQMCFDQGIPLALLAEDGTLYLPVTMAMGTERGDKDLRGHAEHTVTVTGRVISRGGLNTILIESIRM